MLSYSVVSNIVVVHNPGCAIHTNTNLCPTQEVGEFNNPGQALMKTITGFKPGVKGEIIWEKKSPDTHSNIVQFNFSNIVPVTVEIVSRRFTEHRAWTPFRGLALWHVLFTVLSH